MDWSNVRSSAIPTFNTIAIFTGNNLSNVIDFIKIEIFRDFWQIISLFFQGLGSSLPLVFRNLFGNISVIFSICFSCWINTPNIKQLISIIIFVIQFIVVLICLGFFYIKNININSKSQGLETKTWAQSSKNIKLSLKVIILILTSLYLPVFSDIIQIWFCDIKFIANDRICEESIEWYFLIFIGIILFFIYIIYFPVQCILLIRNNKPKPRLFDNEGNARIGGYTKDDYRIDLENDNGPYKVLYDGYERNWSYYKVFVMIMKLLLIFPSITLVRTNLVGTKGSLSRNENNDDRLLLVQSLSASILLLIYYIVSKYSAPFINDSNDKADVVSRTAALAVAVLGLIITQINDGPFKVVLSILLNVTTAIGGITVTVYMLSGSLLVQNILKQMFKRIDLTKTRDFNEDLIFSNKLNINRERKVRIWYEFWDTIIKQDKHLQIPNKNKSDAEDETENDIKTDEKYYNSINHDDRDKNYTPIELGFQYGGSPPWLLGFNNTVGERHAENKEIIKNESYKSYKEMLNIIVNDDTQVLNAMKYCINELNGVDCYWDGKLNGTGGNSTNIVKETIIDNDSASYFGKLYIVPFPFCATFLCDDSKYIKTFSICSHVCGLERDINQSIQDLYYLQNINSDPKILKKKDIRLKLRSMIGQDIEWPIHKELTKTISVDKVGENKKSKEMSILFTFCKGVLNIDTVGDKAYYKLSNDNEIDITKGFIVTVHYHDGFAEYFDEEYNKNYKWENETLIIGKDEFGLTAEFEETDMFNKFMRLNYTNDDEKYEIMDEYKLYRQNYISEFINKEKVLSYGFWYYIYNNDKLSLQELKELLMIEQNDAITSLIDKHKISFDMVYDKLTFFDSNKKYSFWFIFWHDIWVNNMTLKIFKNNKEYLSPYFGQSICYNFIEKNELINKLQELKLYGKEGIIFKGWINDNIIKKLYDVLNTFDKQNDDVILMDNNDDKLKLNDSMTIFDEYKKASTIIQYICDKQ